jgi:hypothetical protein
MSMGRWWNNTDQGSRSTRRKSVHLFKFQLVPYREHRGIPLGSPASDFCVGKEWLLVERIVQSVLIRACIVWTQCRGLSLTMGIYTYTRIKNFEGLQS